jgi:hypothetical protein
MTRGRARNSIVRLLLVTLMAAAGAGSMGCAAHVVPAYQREHLVDPIMSFKSEARRDARRTKALEAREGSTGGNGGEGGGCACK